MQGIVFNVESPNKESGNALWIVPSGLSETEKAIHLPVAGVVKKAQVACYFTANRDVSCKKEARSRTQIGIKPTKLCART